MSAAYSLINDAGVPPLPITVPVTKLIIPPIMMYTTGSHIAYLKCFLLRREKIKQAHEPQRKKASPVSRRDQYIVYLHMAVIVGS
jgi:hypothetical protein